MLGFDVAKRPRRQKRGASFVSWYKIFGIGWLFIISVITVLHVGPHILNADILLNTIMSLQNVTLYYWGQNRLLNIVPFVVSSIEEPSLNLTAVLLIASVSFYSLVYMMVRVATMTVDSATDTSLSLSVFLLLSSAFNLLFSVTALGNMAVWHVQYSLSLLLTTAAYLILFDSSWSRIYIWKVFFSSVSLILSIGLNPSVVIPAFLIGIAVCVYRRKVGFAEFVLTSISGVSFFAWDFVANQYGSMPYSQFSLNALPVALQEVFSSMLPEVNLLYLLLLGSLILFHRIIIALLNGSTNQHYSIVRYVTGISLLFALGWTILFASNKWVEMNGYHWRYFIYPVFAIAFVFALYLSSVCKQLGSRWSLFVAVLVSGCTIALMALSIPTLNFSQYPVFDRVNKMTKPGSKLYAGNYWDVWPSVLRDMMSGHEAYGLTYRGEANAEAARKFALDVEARDGGLTVYCLSSRESECLSNVNSIIGPWYLTETVPEGQNVLRLKLMRHIARLDFDKTDLASLPSQVGRAYSDGIETNHQSGFMVFGPYAPVAAGEYILDIFGSGSQINGAYAEVVSDKGRTLHAKYGLKGLPGNLLLSDGKIKLPVDVEDLEVRVWVTESDVLSLLGYRLDKAQ